jgi:iron complex outermembrane receptor protein
LWLPAENLQRLCSLISDLQLLKILNNPIVNNTTFPLSLVCLATGLFSSTHAIASVDTTPPALTDARVPMEIETTEVHSESVDGRHYIEQQLQRIPGGSQLIRSETFLNGRTQGLADVLQYAAGVYVGDEGLNQQVRLSIRGSGIQTRFGGSGIQLLYNGIPLNRADGSFETQSIDVSSADAIEVIRGGNALQYGSAQLGGSINVITPTGKTDKGTSLMLSYGSWDTLQVQGQSGHHWGDTDSWVSMGYRQSQGFREHSSTSSRILNANYGWQWTDRVENRLYILYSDGRRRLPGSLTEQEVMHDPRASLEPTNVWRRDIKDFLLANRTQWYTDQMQGDFSVYVEQTRFWHPVSNPPLNFEFNDTYWTYGASLSLSSTSRIIGLNQEWTAGLRMAYTDAKRRGAQPVFIPPFPRRPIVTDQTATQWEVWLSDQIEITDDCFLVLGGLLTYATRQQTDHVAPANDYDRSYSRISPSIGLLYKVEENLTLYSNYHWSYEPPRWGSLADRSDLRPQRARTFEVGMRGTLGDTILDINYYYSHVRDRFIYVAIPPTPVAAVSNSNTIQQGVEIATETVLSNLWLQSPSSYTISLRQSFTWSDFHFDNDPIRQNHRLPIVPEFVWRGELMTQFDNGLYIAPSVEWVFGQRPIDNANSAYVDGYAILNLKAGYQIDSHWRVFSEIRNLFDQRYVATMVLNDRTTLDSRSFSPGEPLSVYFGVHYDF